MATDINDIKQTIKKFLPSFVLQWKKNRQVNKSRAINKRLSAKQVFTRIYLNNEWGGEGDQFYSGSGSEANVSAPYCIAVKEFIQERGIQSVVDLGCGDFRVGQNIQVSGVSYIGIDIVESLIERNQKLFGNSFITFICLDIIDDPLPDGELCLIRQVFQHLSNDQIKKILNKLDKYKYVLISEHYPSEVGAVIQPNLDKPHGGDTRIVNNSGVFLDKPPFDVPNISIFLTIELTSCLIKKGEVIRTILIDNSKLQVV